MVMRPGVHLLLTPLIEVGGTAPVQAVPAPWHQYIYISTGLANYRQFSVQSSYCANCVMEAAHC
jgi:hypothetical protein